VAANWRGCDVAPAEDHAALSAAHAAADQRRASRQARPQSENLEQSLFQFPCSTCPRPATTAKAVRSPVGGVALALPTRRFRSGLSRLISFCERESIPPTAVSDEVSARFRAHLESDTRVPSPPDCHRRTCRLWNAAADIVPDWPQSRLGLPDHRRPRRSLPLSSYPASLQEELEWCVAPLGCRDRFAEFGPQKPLRPSTVKKIRSEVALALSAVVEAGRDPASITSLRCLFAPDAFETALRRYLNKDEQQTPRPTAHNIASTLIGLAKRYLGSDASALDQLAELERLRKCLGPPPKGLTKKNRNLLRALDDPGLRAKLHFVPEGRSRRQAGGRVGRAGTSNLMNVRLTEAEIHAVSMACRTAVSSHR